MRLSVLNAVAALAASACAVAEPEPTAAAEPVAKPAAECAVLVRFGSYASGIDTPTADAALTALQADRRTASVTVRPWGREGERDLCVTPRTPADAAQLVKTARGVLPQRKLNGYVDIQLNGKRVFTTQS